MTNGPPRRIFRSVALKCSAAGVGVLIAVFAVLVIVEAGYRVGGLDPHGAELKAFNPDLVTGSWGGSTLLALGDSFTAGTESWPFALQSTLGEEWRVVNSGVGGTTITHARLAAKRRIRQFDPDVVVFQTYVGNDLLDLRHPRNSPEIGLARRVYWWVVDSGAFAPWYLNHRAAGLAARRPFDPEVAAEAVSAPFSVDRFSPRDRWLSQVDSANVERQILVNAPSTEAAWRRYEKNLHNLAAQCRESGADLVILVVPHCIQVASVYRERFAALGASWEDEDLLRRSPTPFVTRVREALPSARVVDPLQAMQQAESGGARIYSTNDPHLTAEGAWLLALEVAVAVRR